MFRCSASVVFVVALLAQCLPAMAQRPLTPDQERALKPKDEFQECETCPRMVVVPAGKFLMGSPPGEEKRDADEGPEHEVTISRPFAVGKFEVTMREWKACVDGGSCKSNKDLVDFVKDLSNYQMRLPVNSMNFADVKEYLSWLSANTGKAYRLLSEAEWEYAARAGTRTPFNTGATITTAQANYNGDHTYGPNGRKGDNRGLAIEVGSFPANAFGLHDMHGNVLEWIEDCWHPTYDKAPSDGSARIQPGCASRVIRGGSFLQPPHFLRSANRFELAADQAGFGLGFRVARTLGQ